LILVGTFFIIGLSQIITKQRRFAK